MKKINYKKIYQFVKNQFEKTDYFSTGPFDESYYTLRVYETAKIIIKKLNQKVNKDVVLVAALFHDIGKTKLDEKILFGRYYSKRRKEEWYKHAGLSVGIAEKYLKKNKFPTYFIDEVLYLVKNHDSRGDKLKDKTLELEILQDADVVADIGFAGFIRPFLYAGKFKDNIISTINIIKEKKGISVGKELNLKVSKIMAKEDMKIQKSLAKEIYKEIKSDLL